MEGFLELVGIALGRYFFGVIGYYVRTFFVFLIGKRKKTGSNWGLDKVIDTNDFKDRVVGFFFVMVVIVILIQI